ncbi:hypothetical protein R3P38DRAFT_3380190 [Favolaschia claudopus]|uniref:Uncharacterized protein n=1 Tax=Favolaschia claudopus TaxID=2862362 RepID=A0AAV9Z2R7_9AGAR
MVESPRMAQQVSLTCYMALNGNRRAKTETLIAQSILYRLPWGYKATLPAIALNQAKVFGTKHYRSLVSWQGLNLARQHQSRDVKVGDNPTARMLSFGKEIEEHTIQQGSVRVNNRMQQDIGELAAHSCPLERKGNQGQNSTQYKQRHIVFKAAKPIQDCVAPAKWTRLSPSTNSQSQCLVMEQSLGDIAWNTEGDPERLAIFPGNRVPYSVQRVPKPVEFIWPWTAWERIGQNNLAKGMETLE